MAFTRYSLGRIVIGFMGSIKLAPAAMLGWTLGSGSRSSLAAAFMSVLALFALTWLVAGPANLAEYIPAVFAVRPSALSISSLTGIPWASFAVLAIGSAAAIVSGARPAVSFSIAVVTMTLGTPTLYLSGLVPLLAVLAPIAAAKPSRAWGWRARHAVAR